MIRGLERERETGGGVLRKALASATDQRDVPAMIAAVEALGVRAEAEAEVERHNEAALLALDAVAVAEELKKPLRALAAALLDRAS